MAKALSQSELLKRTLGLMEEENWITQKVGRDFMESMAQVVEAELGAGRPVNLLGLVKLTPRFSEGGIREVLKEFGNPEAGKEKRRFKAAVKLRASALKRAKSSLPSPQSAAAKALKK